MSANEGYPRYCPSPSKRAPQCERALLRVTGRSSQLGCAEVYRRGSPVADAAFTASPKVRPVYRGHRCGQPYRRRQLSFNEKGSHDRGSARDHRHHAGNRVPHRPIHQMPTRADSCASMPCLPTAEFDDESGFDRRAMELARFISQRDAHRSGIIPAIILAGVREKPFIADDRDDAPLLTMQA